MQGLRSVGELILPDQAVDRIGHALALDSTVAEFVAPDWPRELHRRDVLEDLCWLVQAAPHLSLGDNFTDGARKLLDDLVIESGLADHHVSSRDLLGAWLARRDISGHRLHLQSSSDGCMPAQLNDPPAALTAFHPDWMDPISRAFVFLTHGGPGLLRWLDKPVPPGLASRFRQFCEQYEEPVSTKLCRILAAKEPPVVVESCPTSNMRLAGLPSPRYLPIHHWQNAGLAVSVSSDDPLIFGNTVDREFDMLRAGANMAIDFDDLARVSRETCCNGAAPMSGADYRLLADWIPG
jgi:hypothetical protein